MLDVQCCRGGPAGPDAGSGLGVLADDGRFYWVRVLWWEVVVESGGTRASTFRTMEGDTSARALDLLRQALGPDEEFRDQQLDAILKLVDERGRALVVQRTGWGKSVVYFIATKLLRDGGAGPTILISPLL